MDLGERCVITMLITRLLMSHADNLGIRKVRCDYNNYKCAHLINF